MPAYCKDLFGSVLPGRWICKSQAGVAPWVHDWRGLRDISEIDVITCGMSFLPSPL